jgi:flagellar hook-length control protein FliK
MSEDQVNVSLSSRHAIVREAMEQALPKLREMLDENGFNLADADVSKHSFAEQRERNAENKSNMSSNNHNQLISSERSEPTLQRSSQPAGVVDYFV